MTTPAPDTPSPIVAFALDERPPRELDWAAIENLDEDAGALWLHLDITDEKSRRWLSERAGLDPLVVAGLLDENARPRISPIGNGLLATVRGINLNPGATPDELISLRFWATATRVITLRMFRFASVRVVMDSVREGSGPTTTGGLIAVVLRELTARVEPPVFELGARLDDLEAQTIDPDRPDPERRVLMGMRRQVITLSRYLEPQAAAMRSLARVAPTWLPDADRDSIAESTNRLIRLVEDLESHASRAQVVQDEIANKLTERLGERTYALTVIAGIMLPLTLLTGVFGMNVGGMPLVNHPNGFWLVSIGMLVIGAVGGWLAKRAGWL